MCELKGENSSLDERRLFMNDVFSTLYGSMVFLFCGFFLFYNFLCMVEYEYEVIYFTLLLKACRRSPSVTIESR